ncbi:MAG: FkbM family methyltransferase [Bacteroidota bacterium]|jgi:FkbM family methyltransferase
MLSSFKPILRSVYRGLPLKRQFYSLLRSVWSPPEPIYRHLHFTGPFTVAVDSERIFRMQHFGNQIENEVFWSGLRSSWERESMQLWIRLCEHAHTIIDVGANSGIYALVAKTIQPNARVLAFEPHPLFYEMLETNVRLNRIDITSVEKAVSDQNENVIIEDYSGKSEHITVACTTLDAAVRAYSLDHIDLIKIDVEQHEPQVLAGFKQHLAAFKPTLLIEILTNSVAEQVYESVKDLGYLYYNIDETKGVRRTERLEKSDYYNYLLCSPETAQMLGLELPQNGL